MLRRYVILINFLLIVAGLFFAVRVYNIWKADVYQDLASFTEDNQPIFSVPKLSASPKPSKNTFQVIIDKDLFRPERTEWKAQTKGEEGPVSESAPQLVVYGIVIAEDFKYAWVEEESKGRSNKIEKVAEGGKISGWEVREINTEGVTITDGEETISYSLIEPGKPKKRKAFRPATPKVSPKPPRSAKPRSTKSPPRPSRPQPMHPRVPPRPPMPPQPPR